MYNSAFARLEAPLMNMTERDRHIINERKEVRDILRPKWKRALEGKMGDGEKDEVRSIWPDEESEGKWCVVEVELSGDGKTTNVVWPAELCVIEYGLDQRKEPEPFKDRDVNGPDPGTEPSSLAASSAHRAEGSGFPLRERTSKGTRKMLVQRLHRSSLSKEVEVPQDPIERLMDAGGGYIEYLMREKEREREREKESVVRAKSGRKKTPSQGVVNGVVSITPLSLTDSPDVVMAASTNDLPKSNGVDGGDSFMGLGFSAGYWMDGDVDMMKEFTGLEDADFDFYNDEKGIDGNFDPSRDEMDISQPVSHPLPPTPMLPNSPSIPSSIASKELLPSPTTFTFAHDGTRATHLALAHHPGMDSSMQYLPQVPPAPLEKVTDDLAEIVISDLPSSIPVDPSPASIPSSKEEIPIKNRKQDAPYSDKANGYLPNANGLFHISPNRQIRKRASSTDGRLPLSKPRFPITFSPPRNQEYPVFRQGHFGPSPVSFTDPKWTRANGLRERENLRENGGRKVQKITHGGMSMQRRDPVVNGNTRVTFSRQPSWNTAVRGMDELDMRRQRVEDRKHLEQKQRELIIGVGSLQLDESEDEEFSDDTEDAITFSSPAALTQAELDAQMLSMAKLTIVDQRTDGCLSTDLMLFERDVLHDPRSDDNHLSRLFPSHSSLTDEFLSELISHLFATDNVFPSPSISESVSVPSSLHAVQLLAVHSCSPFISLASVNQANQFVFSEAPRINVCHQGWTVKLSAVSLRFWENIQLEPVYGAKTINALLLLEPADLALKSKGSAWLDELAQVYSDSYLGDLQPFSSDSVAMLPSYDTPDRIKYLTDLCTNVSAATPKSSSAVIFVLSGAGVVDLTLQIRKLIGAKTKVHIHIIDRSTFITSLSGVATDGPMPPSAAARFRHLSFNTYDQIYMPVWRHSPKRLVPLVVETRPREIIDLTEDTEDGPRIAEDESAKAKLDKAEHLRYFYHPSFTLSEDDANLASVFGERTRPFLKKLVPTAPSGVHMNEGRVLFVGYCFLPSVKDTVNEVTKNTEDGKLVERLLVCWEDDRGEGRDFSVCRVEGESWLSYNEDGVAVKKKLTQERERVETVWKTIRAKALENSNTAWRTIAIVRRAEELGWLEMKGMNLGSVSRNPKISRSTTDRPISPSSQWMKHRFLIFQFYASVSCQKKSPQVQPTQILPRSLLPTKNAKPSAKGS
ncbi:hypothetical protein BT69DRAFT_205270 [Atractiella rhizophila]|nr:hypothetical protein BT69DRAFT_205270 [Atractiella rhizophila]